MIPTPLKHPADTAGRWSVPRGERLSPNDRNAVGGDRPPHAVEKRNCGDDAPLVRLDEDAL
jgi:hypothetical protein